jgi:hypothetical protein
MAQIILFGLSRKATDFTNGYAQLIGDFSRSNPNIIGSNAQQKSVESVQSVVDKN